MADATLGGPGGPRKVTETRPTGANPSTNPLSEAVHGFVLPGAIEKYQDGVQLLIHLMCPVDITQNPMKYEMAVRTVPGGTPKWVYDAAVDDSDKSFTVPTGKQWKMRYLAYSLKATATVGNRLMQMKITDGTNPIYPGYYPNTNLAASAYGSVIVSFGSVTPNAPTTRYGLDYANTSTVNYVEVYPEMTLTAGFIIRCWDSAAIDPAADDMAVSIHYIEYDA
jgi:hypothetical protein